MRHVCPPVSETPVLSHPGELMEDHELIDRLRDGDQTVIDAVVERYKDPLFAFILRMTGDYTAAEDLFQETWLRVIRYIGKFRGESKLSTWLFQIAVNLVRDAERKKKRWRTVEIDDHSDVFAHGPEVDPMAVIRERQVKRILSEIPAKMREVVVLKYYHDLNDAEIAGILSCPEATVKSRYYRALEAMKKKWNHMEKEIERENGLYGTA